MTAKNIEVENVDRRDYPDFTDAYAVYAEHADGTPFTDEELDGLKDDGTLIEHIHEHQLWQ